MNSQDTADIDAERFARLREAFHRCCDADAEGRAKLIEALRAEDPALAAEVEGLLRAAAADAAPAVLEIGGFRLIEEIGRGGMGVVWRAQREHAGFAQQVALKLLHGGGRSAAAAHRFLREWRVLARLQHPGIARLVDAGVDAGQPWLAMEFVDGEGFAQACANLPLRRRVEWLVEACEALAYAHARLVLHRDIKPANLRLGGDGHLRLLDFGIARLLDDSDGEPTLPGMAIGTPRYAAPEQVRGELVGTAADVYALGRVLEESCVPPGASDPLLAAIVARACAPAADARYPGAAALGDDLRDWLAGRSLRSGVGSRRARLRRWLWQRRWPVGSGVAIALVLAAGVLSTLSQAQRAREEAARAREHLAALLDVIGAASPDVYAGRDPVASDFLLEAARRLRALPASDPELQWQSLAQIGNGLINLGRPSAAVGVLQAALEAVEQGPHPQQAGRRLDGLRLLLLAQDAGADPSALDAIIARIASAAAQPQAPAGAALSALASAAAVCSRRGRFERSRELLALAEPLLSGSGIEETQRENYWRQRGWSALRARALDDAMPALKAALASIEATPASFSAMRRAEAHWLLAEALLQGDDAEGARRHLALATPDYQREYPADHGERGTLALMWARAELLAGDAQAAAGWLAQARPAFAGGSVDPVDAHHQAAVETQVAAALGDCTAALAAITQLPALPGHALLPHRRHIEDQARVAASRCRAGG